MSLWDDLKKKAVQANPELAEKAAQALKRANELAVEASQKAAPVLKDAADKAAQFAKENAPVAKAKAISVYEEQKIKRAELREQARQDKAARAEYIRTMYDTALRAEDENFLDESFVHLEKELFFFTITGQVLDTQKRSEMQMHTSHHHNGGGGYIYNGTGGVSGGSSSMHLSCHTTTAHEFWIKTLDGKEACFGFPDSRVQMRNSQWLTLVFVGVRGTNQGVMCSIYNHAAQEHMRVMDSAQIDRYFALHTEVPGFFNKKEVEATYHRLLRELSLRLTQIGDHVALHNHVPSS